MATLSQYTGSPMFPGNPNGMDGSGGPPPYFTPPHHYGHQQPAPRQRTAIACRYCRRRKIRCSGFDTSTDGRCANCLRFNQECVFTPVSSQTQAFVPAHAHQIPGRPTQLYGPQGHPLPPNYEYHPPHVYPPHPPHRLPSPGPRDPHPAHPSHHERHPLPPLHPERFGRRGSTDDVFTATHYTVQPTSPSSHLPAPHPFASPPTRYGQGGPPAPPYHYNPDQHPPPLREPSPGHAHQADPRDHRTVSPTPPMIHPPMVRPSSTSPHPGPGIPPMNISGIIDPPQPPQPGQHQQRSAADGDMLNRLNARPGF